MGWVRKCNSLKGGLGRRAGSGTITPQAGGTILFLLYDACELSFHCEMRLLSGLVSDSDRDGVATYLAS